MNKLEQYIVDDVQREEHEGGYSAVYGITGYTHEYTDIGAGPMLTGSWAQTGLTGVRKGANYTITTYTFMHPKTGERFQEKKGNLPYECPFFLKKDTIIKLAKIDVCDRLLEHYHYEGKDMLRVSSSAKGTHEFKHIYDTSNIHGIQRELVCFDHITSKPLEKIVNQEQYMKYSNADTSRRAIQSYLSHKKKWYILPDIAIITLLMWYITKNMDMIIPDMVFYGMVGVVALFNYLWEWSLYLRSVLQGHSFSQKMLKEDFNERVLASRIKMHNEQQKHIHLSDIIDFFRKADAPSKEIFYDSDDKEYVELLKTYTTLSSQEINQFIALSHKDT